MGNEPPGLVDQRDKVVELRPSDKHEKVAVFDEVSSRGVKPYATDVYHSVDIVKAAKAVRQAPCQRIEHQGGCFSATWGNEDRQLTGQQLATPLQSVDGQLMSGCS